MVDNNVDTSSSPLPQLDKVPSIKFVKFMREKTTKVEGWKTLAYCHFLERVKLEEKHIVL